MSDNERTVVVLTSGRQDRGTRATLAFGWACAAQAMGKDVIMYLTMDGTVWAMKGAAEGVQVPGFEPLANYLEQFFDFEGKMLVCAPCTEYYCSLDFMGENDRLLDGAEIVGLATIVGQVEPGTTVVTF